MLVTWFANGRTDVARSGDRVCVLGALFARLTKPPDGSQRYDAIVSAFSGEAFGRAKLVDLAIPMTLADRKGFCEKLTIWQTHVSIHIKKKGDKPVLHRSGESAHDAE